MFSRHGTPRTEKLMASIKKKLTVDEFNQLTAYFVAERDRVMNEKGEMTAEQCYDNLKIVWPHCRIAVGICTVGSRMLHFVSMIGLRNVHFKTFYGTSFKQVGARYINEASIAGLHRSFDPIIYDKRRKK